MCSFLSAEDQLQMAVRQTVHQQRQQPLDVQQHLLLKGSHNLRHADLCRQQVTGSAGHPPAAGGRRGARACALCGCQPEEAADRPGHLMGHIPGGHHGDFRTWFQGLAIAHGAAHRLRVWKQHLDPAVTWQLA